MFINGLGTATPPRRYHQTECWEGLKRTTVFASLTPSSQALLQRLLKGDNGIASRYLALDSLAEIDDFNPDALNRRYTRHAPALAVQAAERALADARVRCEHIDAIVVSTCTGYLCPGLSIYLVERLPLRPDVLAFDLVGHGCAAALPNLRAAAALLSAASVGTVLSVCVEVCSAAFYLDDDPGVLVSASLFGDGAGAAVLGNTPDPQRRRIEWTAYGSIVDPSRRELLRFEHKDGMLRNILTPPVPELASQFAQQVLAGVLGEAGLRQDDIRTWVWHAGGREVLRQLQARLGLETQTLHWSRRVLNEYGNLSSAFVYFVMQAALRDAAPGGWWWLSSFGAGFSCHGALLAVS